jgi:hypothetical protein
MEHQAALKSQRDTRDGFSVVAEVANLDDEICYRVTDESSKDEIVIPARFLDILNQTSPELTKVMLSRKSTAQQTANDPERVFGLMSFGSMDTSRTQFHSRAQFRYLKGHDIAVSGTPMLTWLSEEDNAQRVKEGGSQITREVTPYGAQVAGWNLTLTGSADVSLGFARWNDFAGVASLVASMEDPEALAVSLALLAPEEASVLAAQQNFLSLSDANALPTIEPKLVKKFLQDHDLCGKGDGIISTLEITMNARTVPVAIGIKRPSSPNFASEKMLRAKERSVSLGDTGSNIGEIESIKTQALIEWGTRFKEAVSGSEWRLVDIPYPYSRKGLELMWITKIELKPWSAIKALVHVSPMREHLRGLYF